MSIIYKYQLGMSAQEARQQGFPVPEDVPDCASLWPADDANPKVTIDEADPQRINFSLKLKWSWVELTAKEVK